MAEHPHRTIGDSGEGRACASTPAPPGSASMAAPVTRHAPITGPKDWQFLACGIDTLDLSFWIDWGKDWKYLVERLQERREAAQNSEGAIWDSPLGPCIVYPHGRKPIYKFCLQFPDYRIAIAGQEKPKTAPNVVASISSRLLWDVGATNATERISEFFTKLGGTIQRISPSRCDLAADFLVPDGFALDFLRTFRVCKSRTWRPFMEDEAVETCYFGKASGKVQCRLYNKGLEVLRKGEKLWFLDVWKTDSAEGVWRVEFQLRREVLKEYAIYSLPELLAAVSAIWRYFTNDWLSFRLHDDTNTSRRTIHHWWVAVQDCHRIIGPESDAQRNLVANSPAAVEWYKSHLAGCLSGYAARLGLADMNQALCNLADDVTEYWQGRDWSSEFARKVILLNRDPVAFEEQEGCDVPF